MEPILVVIFIAVLVTGVVTIYNAVTENADTPAVTSGPGGSNPDTQVH